MPFSFKNRYRPLSWLITQLFFVVQHQSPCLYLGFLFSLDHLNLICAFHLLFHFPLSVPHPTDNQNICNAFFYLSKRVLQASMGAFLSIDYFLCPYYRLSIHRSFSFILAIFAPFLSSQQVRRFSYSSVYK